VYSTDGYLDLLGPCGFLSLGDGSSEELGLDSLLELCRGGIGHLLLLLGGLHCDLLGGDLRKITELVSFIVPIDYYLLCSLQW